MILLKILGVWTLASVTFVFLILASGSINSNWTLVSIVKKARMNIRILWITSDRNLLTFLLLFPIAVIFFWTATDKWTNEKLTEMEFEHRCRN